MELVFYEDARIDLKQMDGTLREFFRKHVEKISKMPPRRHLRFGVPYNVEDVTKQARLVYSYKNDETLLIIRCFTTHKEYEKWYKSYKS